MRDYGKVHSSFWTSSDMRELSEDARSLAIYLLTCPHGTIAGVFRLPDGYVTDDMQWTSQRVSKGFTELLAKGFSIRCEDTKWVWIIKHFAWNPIEGSPQKTGARKIADQIPKQCGWISQYIRDCAELIDWKDYPKNTLSDRVLDTVSDTVPSPVTVTVDVDVDVDVDVTRENEKLFERFWSSYPNHSAKQNALKAWKKLKLKADDPRIEAMRHALTLAKQSREWTNNGGEFIPHAATWLNGQRWEDELTPANIIPIGGMEAVTQSAQVAL